MGIWTLTGELDGSDEAAVFVDSVTMTAFGPVMRDEEEADHFLNFLRTIDLNARGASDDQLHNALSVFRQTLHITAEMLGTEWRGNDTDLQEFADQLSEQVGRMVKAVEPAGPFGDQADRVRRLTQYVSEQVDWERYGLAAGQSSADSAVRVMKAQADEIERLKARVAGLEKERDRAQSLSEHDRERAEKWHAYARRLENAIRACAEDGGGTMEERRLRHLQRVREAMAEVEQGPGGSEGDRDSAETAGEERATCTTDPNTCLTAFCEWPRCNEVSPGAAQGDGESDGRSANKDRDSDSPKPKEPRPLASGAGGSGGVVGLNCGWFDAMPPPEQRDNGNYVSGFRRGWNEAFVALGQEESGPYEDEVKSACGREPPLEQRAASPAPALAKLDAQGGECWDIDSAGRFKLEVSPGAAQSDGESDLSHAGPEVRSAFLGVGVSGGEEQRAGGSGDTLEAQKPVEVTFVIYGEDVMTKLPPTSTLREGRDAALLQSEMTGRPPDEWEARTEGGVLLDPDEAVGVLGVGGKRVFLSLRVGVGGSGGARALFCHGCDQIRKHRDHLIQTWICNTCDGEFAVGPTGTYLSPDIAAKVRRLCEDAIARDKKRIEHGMGRAEGHFARAILAALDAQGEQEPLEELWAKCRRLSPHCVMVELAGISQTTGRPCGFHAFEDPEAPGSPVVRQGTGPTIRAALEALLEKLDAQGGE